MAHPTDDELEATAQRLELVAPTDVEVVDMLRACKGRVRVTPLEWEYHPAGTIAAPPTGRAYIIDTRMKGRCYSVKGFNPQRQFDSLGEAKAAAQADYEARILAAIDPSDAERDALRAELVSTLSAAILDAQIRALETRKLDTPDQIRASAWDFLARHQKGPSHD